MKDSHRAIVIELEHASVDERYDRKARAAWDVSGRTELGVLQTGREMGGDAVKLITRFSHSTKTAKIEESVECHFDLRNGFALGRRVSLFGLVHDGMASFAGKLIAPSFPFFSLYRPKLGKICSNFGR